MVNDVRIFIHKKYAKCLNTFEILYCVLSRNSFTDLEKIIPHDFRRRIMIVDHYDKKVEKTLKI